MANLKGKKWIVGVVILSFMMLTKSSIAEVNSSESTEFRILQEDELESIKGGENCQNPPEDAGQNNDEKSPDPVTFNNGNLSSGYTDLLIPALGPDLEIARTYNSQITSRVEGWQPEKGAGPWLVENGSYTGHGDRTGTGSTWSDFTLTLDMKTVEAGANYTWETARVNFRYTDKDNTYYVLIHTNGTLELSKFQNGTHYLLANGTNTYDPLIWNTIKVETSGSNIKVYVNTTLEIDYTDSTPLTSGKIALESFYCNGSFDNVSITDGTQSESYDFNFDDNETIFGKHWTFNYGLTATEYSDESVVILREDGRKDTFTKNPDGTYNPPYKGIRHLNQDGKRRYLKAKEWYRISL